MPLGWDRVKASFFALVGAAEPRAAYHGLYRGTVVSQDGDAVDLKMDDPRLPGVSALPIQVGLPGSSVQFTAGARMLIAFENGDPAKPIALLWDAGVGAAVTGMTLGGHDATEQLILGTSYRTQEMKTIAMFLAWCQQATLTISATLPPTNPGKATLAVLTTELNKEVVAFNGQFYLSDVVKTV